MDVDNILLKLSQMEENTNQQFSRLNNGMSVMNQKLEGITKQVTNNTEKIDALTTTVANHSAKFDTLTATVDSHTEKFDVLSTDLNEIKTSTKRIEKNMSDDIVAMLKVIDRKVESKNSETAVLNNRLFKVESTVEKMVDR